jgi:hypothetical protein
MSDGVVLGDTRVEGDAAAWASYVMSNGDGTGGMPVVYEDGAAQ